MEFWIDEEEVCKGLEKRDKRRRMEFWIDDEAVCKGLEKRNKRAEECGIWDGRRSIVQRSEEREKKRLTDGRQTNRIETKKVEYKTNV